MNSDFNVYKCLYNGQSPEYPRGRPSLVEPTGTSTTVIETNDSSDYKYRWKYMYTIDADNILKFVTSEFIPVLDNALVTAAAGTGSIDTIVIENAVLVITTVHSPTYLFVETGKSMEEPSLTAPSLLCLVLLVMLLLLSLDPITSFASIDVGLIPNIGTGANASLTLSYLPTVVTVKIRSENLARYRLMFASKLETSTAFIDFPTDLTFRRVGLVLNPFDFNTTSVSDQNTRSGVKALIFPQSGTGTPSGTFNPWTTITQATTNAKGFVVSYDSTTKVLKYYQDSVDGVTSGNIIAFSGNNQITSSDLVTATLTPHSVRHLCLWPNHYWRFGIRIGSVFHRRIC